MTKLFTLMVLAIICTSASAQSDSTLVSKRVDTLIIGNIIIVKGVNKANEMKVGMQLRKKENTPKKLSNVSTNWFIFDLGFANYSDQTAYVNANSFLYNRPGATALGKGDFKLNTAKSINVNVWFFMQRLNLIKQHVNLKYGLGLELNNYRFKSGTNISFLEKNPYLPSQATTPIVIRDSVQFSKNKLALDYVTVPLLLNFVTNPGSKNKGLSVSLGVSAGYLYSQRNKQISTERGKQKNKGDYDAERFKLAYIAELGLGPVRLYGSYSPKSIFSNGLNIKAYTIGVRLSNW